jgi:hypothetical protein
MKILIVFTALALAAASQLAYISDMNRYAEAGRYVSYLASEASIAYRLSFGDAAAGGLADAVGSGGAGDLADAVDSGSADNLNRADGLDSMGGIGSSGVSDGSGGLGNSGVSDSVRGSGNPSGFDAYVSRRVASGLVGAPDPLLRTASCSCNVAADGMLRVRVETDDFFRLPFLKADYIEVAGVAD